MAELFSNELISSDVAEYNLQFFLMFTHIVVWRPLLMEMAKFKERSFYSHHGY
jgi:hypothetical protein